MCSRLRTVKVGWMLALLFLAAAPLFALWPSDVEPLTADPDDPKNPDRAEHHPQGSYNNPVSDVDTLYDIFNNLDTVGNKTIVIAAGTYILNDPAAPGADPLRSGPLRIGDNNPWNGPKQDPTRSITIRSKSNEFGGDVVIDATNVDYGFEIFDAQDVRIAFLTVQDAIEHNVLIHGDKNTGGEFKVAWEDPTPGGDNQVGFEIYGCIIKDSGQENIMARSGTGSCEVAYSLIGYSTLPAEGDAWGLHVEHGENWTIRHNFFLWCLPAEKTIPESIPAKLFNGGVLMKWDSQSTIVEGNTFYDCERAVMFGDETDGSTVNTYGHRGGTIKNNFIYRKTFTLGNTLSKTFPWYDQETNAIASERTERVTGPAELVDLPQIELLDSLETEVLHNTIYIADGSAAAIRAWGRDSGALVIMHNLITPQHPIQLNTFSTANPTDNSNHFWATEAMFRNPDTGNLHLTQSMDVPPPATPPAVLTDPVVEEAPPVVDSVAQLDKCTLDFDEGNRPVTGQTADYGADEWGVKRGEGGTGSTSSGKKKTEEKKVVKYRKRRVAGGGREGYKQAPVDTEGYRDLVGESRSRSDRESSRYDHRQDYRMTGEDRDLKAEYERAKKAKAASSSGNTGGSGGSSSGGRERKTQNRTGGGGGYGGY